MTTTPSIKTSTYSQRPVNTREPVSNVNPFPNLTIQTAVDNSGQVIFTIGPHGGPYQTVYLSQSQVDYLAGTLTHMSRHLSDQQH